MKKIFRGSLLIILCFGITACITTGIQGMAQRGDLDKLRTSIENDKSQIHKKYLYGQTLLHSAAQYGNLNVVKYLVENGADVNAEDRYNYHPINYAVQSNNLELVRYLKDAGANIQAKAGTGPSNLHLAINYNPNPSLFKYLLSEGCDVNAKDDYGMSVLHYAAQSGNVALVKYLVNNGADVNATDSYGQTPASSISEYIDDEDYPTHKEIHSFLMSSAWEPDTFTQNNFVLRSSNSTHKKDSFADDRASMEFQNFASPSENAGSAKNNFAIIIGNNKYKSFPSLKTAVNDAKAVAHLLKSNYDFDSKLIIDGSRLEILHTFDFLRSKLFPSSNLLIYYAGHGYYDQKTERGYWLPVDAQLDTTANWISNADITDKIKAIEAKHIMIVADSCYSGTLTRGLKVTMRDPDYYQKMAAMRSRTALTSGGLEPVADSGGDRNSVFAKAFINALAQNQGILDGTELFAQLRRPVMLNSDQTPEYSDIRKAGHEGGDFLFVRQ